MRVLSGILKSRLFNAPKGNRTHPMGEKIRGAIFNALGDLEGFTVLDAYAGSGALAFESISHGAAKAYLLEKDKKAYKTIVENIEKLGIEDQVKATRANNVTWVKNNPELQFDLVFLDPPYQDVHPGHIAEMAESVKPGGVLVIGHPKYYHPSFEKPQWELVSYRTYANANVSMYRRLA